MKKQKWIAALLVGAMIFSTAGCGKDKETAGRDPAGGSVTDAPEQENEAGGKDRGGTAGDGEERDREQEGSGKDDSVNPEDGSELEESQWKIGGCYRTGYAYVPADWEEHETETEDLYALQYGVENEGVISFVDTQYGYDGCLDGYDETLQTMIDFYIDLYAEQGGIHERTEEIFLDGETAILSVDWVPEDMYVYENQYDDYYFYTYLAIKDGKFYTFVIEGYVEAIGEVKDKFEETYEFPENDEEVYGGSGQDGFDAPVGSGDWESYQVCVDGDVYTLPCDFSVMEGNGWVLDAEYESLVLGEEEYTIAWIQKGSYSAWIMLGNVYESGQIAGEDAQIVGIMIDDNLEGTQSYIDGGICLGMSYNEVIDRIGIPTKEEADDEYDYKKLTYEGADFEWDLFSELEIFIMYDEVIEIEIRHW